MQLKKKPYNLLLYTGGVLILMSFLKLNHSATIDLHLHDTYFVIAHTQVFCLLAIVAFFVWALYLLTNKTLYSKTLTWTHITITIITLFLFVFILFFGESFLNPLPRLYYDFSEWNSSGTYNSYTKTITLSIFVLLWGQIIFALNLIAGLFIQKPLKKLP